MRNSVTLRREGDVIFRAHRTFRRQKYIQTNVMMLVTRRYNTIHEYLDPSLREVERRKEDDAEHAQRHS